MNTILQKLRDASMCAWLNFVQALNTILVGLLGGVLVVYQAYPDLIRDIFGKLPPIVGVPVIFVLGVLIHYSLKQAKKAA